MNRGYYLSLAARGLRMPIGTDLVLHEYTDAESIMNDGAGLGRVVEAAARRYRTPLAVPLMDLRLEKADLAAMLGIPEAETETFHFPAAPGPEVLKTVAASAEAPFARRNQAHLDAIGYIAGNTGLWPVGMGIGPFSLMTKLVSDPITAVALAGSGITSEEDEGVLLVEEALALAELVIARSVRAQIAKGAKAIIVCEPAANIVYLSPRQMERGGDLLERFVLGPNLRLRQILLEEGVDLIFHDCGELNSTMVAEFGHRLHPVILSLGSSRRLWEDAARIPQNVVLFGNLPTKTFYSDAAMPKEQVHDLAVDVSRRMKDCGHPYILGSECDVLHVPDAAETIRRKVDVMLQAGITQ